MGGKTMNARQRLLVPLAAMVAAGCSTPGAIFVTKTSLAVADFDSTPGEMTVAMHRVEGFIAPRNENGNTPPVLAHLQSNRAYWYPEVQQVYATGTAAERLAGDFKSNNSDCTTCKKKNETQATPVITPVIFTTSTTLGLRIGVSTQNVPDGLVLGYRRKEMSFVPTLAEDKGGNYRYPSLIAAIRINQPNQGNGKFSACQGFATGTAANKLAESQDSSGLGCLPANQSVRSLLAGKQGAEFRQHEEVVRALACYVALPEARKLIVQENAARFFAASAGGMVRTADDGLKLKASAAVDEDTRYVQRLVGAIVPDSVEDQDLGSANAASALLREHQLRAHREVVCAPVPEPKLAVQVP
jgi:hypothetical protein